MYVVIIPEEGEQTSLGHLSGELDALSETSLRASLASLVYPLLSLLDVYAVLGGADASAREVVAGRFGGGGYVG